VRAGIHVSTYLPHCRGIDEALALVVPSPNELHAFGCLISIKYRQTSIKLKPYLVLKFFF